MLRVADYSNDAASRSTFNKLDLLTDRILTGPELFSHRLVDNEDSWCVSTIFTAKRPTLKERNANRLEVVWHHRIEHDLRFSTGLRRVPIGENDCCSSAIPTERKSANQRN